MSTEWALRTGPVLGQWDRYFEQGAVSMEGRGRRAPLPLPTGQFVRGREIEISLQHKGTH